MKADSANSVPVTRYEALWAAMALNTFFNIGQAQLKKYTSTTMFKVDGGGDTVSIQLARYDRYGIHLVCDPDNVLDMMFAYIIPSEDYTKDTADLRQLPQEFALLITNAVGADVLLQFLREVRDENKNKK